MKNLKRIKALQNEISWKFLEGSDLGQREQEVLRDVSQRTGFIPTKLIDRSSWWGSTEIGAFHYEGEFDGRRATLKVQGVKPRTSEIYMIESFARTNKSRILRPPHLYATLPWDDKRRYEALIMEYIGTKKIMKVPTNKDEVKRYYELFADYRKNCRESPWLEKPALILPEKMRENFKKWREASLKIYPVHPLREDSDLELIDRAVNLLVEGYRGVGPEFQHGHLADSDFYQVGKDIVVLSNLYWGWRAPFYDAIFCFHWFIYHLNKVDRIAPYDVEEQRRLWMEEIESLPSSDKERRLLKLALLERAAAGLNLDALSYEKVKPVTSYLVETTRKQVITLINELS